MPAKKKISPSPAPEKIAPGRGEHSPAAKKNGAPSPLAHTEAKEPVVPEATATSEEKEVIFSNAKPTEPIGVGGRGQTPPPIQLPPSKDAFTVKPDTGPAPAPTAASAAPEESPPPIVLPGDEVPLEVLEAAAVSAGEESEYYDYSANDDTQVSLGRTTEDVSYPGSKPYEAARERISPEVLELLEERLRASPKFLKKLPKPKATPAAAAETAALPEEVALPEEDEADEDA
jgi:hypothetical protein